MLRFDDQVDAALISLTKAAPFEEDQVRTLRRISPKYGGMGMWSHGDTLGEFAIVSSRELCGKFISTNFHFLSDSMNTHWARTQLEIEDNFEGISPEDEEAGEQKKQIRNRRYKRISTHFHANLKEDCWKARFKSQCHKFSARWCFARVGRLQHYFFTNEMFSHHIRLAYLLPALGHLPQLPCVCGDRPAHPLHALDCEVTRPDCQSRHDAVKDALFSLLRSGCLQTEIRREFAKEVTLGEKRADILMTSGMTKTVIDITIVNPTQQLLLANAADNGDEAVTRGITRKEEQWRDFLAARNRTGNYTWELVPFALDTTGRFSAPAMSLLHKVLDKASVIPRFKGDVNTIVSYYTARMLRRCLQGDRPGGVGGGGGV